jgi:hypothetical protein
MKNNLIIDQNNYFDQKFNQNYQQSIIIDKNQLLIKKSTKIQFY